MSGNYRRFVGLPLAILILGLLVIVTGEQIQKQETGQNDPWRSNSPLGVYDKAGIACDAPECAEIARDILQKKHGTVADAAIAALLCMGVIHAQSSGIGGGFIAVLYDRQSQQSKIINSRETAPAAANKDIFGGISTLSQKGGLAVAVPGEMKGLWYLYKEYGSYKNESGPRWHELLQPTIDLCEKGFTIDGHTDRAIKSSADALLKEPTMKEIFVNPETKELYKLGERMIRPQLAETLKVPAKDDVRGGDLLYDPDSELAQKLAEDLECLGSIITKDDLANYTLYTPDPLVVSIRDNLTVHAAPPPGGGVLAAFVLRLLSTFDLPSTLSTSGPETVRAYQVIVEALKFAYAKRSLIGDPNPTVGDYKFTSFTEGLIKMLTTDDEFLAKVKAKIKEDTTNQSFEYYGANFLGPQDSGTAHLSIIDQYGNAIAVTTTVNLRFGALVRSLQTGIILNNEMDDFSAPGITNFFGVPPSPNNFIRPGKRPMSSMAPLIVTDHCGDVRLVVGAAGGTRITTSVIYVALRNLWFKEDIKTAIDARRLHHQLAPMNLYYETGFHQNIIDGLAKIGHNMTEQGLNLAITGAVAVDQNGRINANCDFRKDCSIAGF